MRWHISFIRWLTIQPGGTALVLWWVKFLPKWYTHNEDIIIPSEIWIPSVIALRKRIPLNIYNFCQRGVGIARFDSWRAKMFPLTAIIPKLSSSGWLLVLLIVCSLLVLYDSFQHSTGFSLAALPVILFNAGTGSDTAASGAGPGTALSGTGAALATSTTVTLSVDAPDLSGVATDGSAAIWVDSSSGRQWGRITAVDDTLKTVTVHSAYGVTESGKNWGIGGKRATLDNADTRTVFADMEAGWEFSLEDNQTITTALAPTVAGTAVLPIIWKSNVSGTARTITQSTSSTASFSLASANNQFYQWHDLNFALSHATKNAAFVLATSSSVGLNFTWLRCSTDSTNKVQSFVNRTGSAIVFGSFIACVIKDCTGAGVDLTASTQILTFYACVIRDNAATAGLLISAGQNIVVCRCIFDTNVGDGLRLLGTWASGTKFICQNAFYANTGDGIEFNTVTATAQASIFNNIFVSNGNFGIRAAASTHLPAFLNYNAFYNNTSGTLSNLTAGANDVTLTGDPFTNAASGDFSLNNNSGAGAACRAIGFPTIFSDGLTNNYLDFGVAQHQDSAGGSSGQAISIFGG